MGQTIIAEHQLNEQQREAVRNNSPVCLVNAAVGSGKTTVLISKILYLHIKHKIPFDKMVVLTFTNKAAAEIKTRLDAVFPGITQEELRYFGTFHHVAMELLRTSLPVEKYGFTPAFQVITPQEEKELILHLIQNNSLSIKYKNRIIKRLETEKASRYGDDLEQLRELLIKTKRSLNQMSFQDLIEYGKELIVELQWRPDWIIVDEVQDSDLAQLEMIQKLKGEKTRLFAVGDPNQVIYSWRGSALNIFYRLKQLYQAEEISLPVNYRSNAAILRAAGVFQERGEKVKAVREEGLPVIIRKQYNTFGEAEDLAERVEKMNQEGIPYEQIAILYRLQSQSKILEDVFMRREIPFQVTGNRRLDEIPVVYWFLKLLRYSWNHSDQAAGEYILTQKNYGPGLSVKKAQKCLEQNQLSLLQKCETEPFMKMLRTAADAPEQFGEFLYEYFDLDEWILPTSSGYSADRKAVLTFCRKMSEALAEDGVSFFEQALSAAALGEQEERTEAHGKAGVQLMTLHASKGLEFSHVFIVGVNDGLLPLYGSKADEFEEERRLLFVGMTRAKDFLELSWYVNPDDPRVFSGPGRFLKAIPSRYLGDESDTGKKTQLHEIRKMVEEEKKNSKAEVEKQTLIRQASHPKYGTGEIVREDEMMVTVYFEGYGEKEFIKAFSEITYL